VPQVRVGQLDRDRTAELGGGPRGIVGRMPEGLVDQRARRRRHAGRA
jgi:hypothetical protein